MIIFERYDDLEWARSESKVQAGHTIRFSYDGSGEHELDVGEENKQRIDTIMKELLAAARKVSKPAAGGQPQTGKRSRGEAIAFFKEMKTWADVNHMMREDDPSVPVYITPGGNLSWPRWVIRKFEDYQRTSNGTAPR